MQLRLKLLGQTRRVRQNRPTKSCAMTGSSRTMRRAIDVYAGSDGEVTKAYYAELEKLGPVGLIALNLFRAQKCSTRAKLYRGGDFRGRFRDQAYERKNWSVANLSAILNQ